MFRRWTAGDAQGNRWLRPAAHAHSAAFPGDRSSDRTAVVLPGVAKVVST